MSPARPRRTPVPAAEAAPATSPALDALTTPTAPSGVVMVPLERIHPHPRNPRRDLGDLTELADSIRSQGVRQNLLLTPDPDRPGEYRTVIGHRRAAAAALADLTEVPAAIDPSLTPEQELELMLVENLQRSDLSAIEEADGYQGLLDLGVTVATIAKKTGRAPKTVRDRIKIAALPDRAREAVHAHQVTLDDALALAEFDGPEDLRKKLLGLLGQPGFANWVVQLKREAKDRAAVAQETEKLKAAGVKILKAGNYGMTPKGVTMLQHIRARGKDETKPMTPGQHKKCPGHVAWIYAGWNGVSVSYGCRDVAANGHVTFGASREPSEEERRETEENNKASAAAEEVRRAWIRDELLKRAKFPDDAVVYVALTLHANSYPNYAERELYAEFVHGGEPDAPWKYSADGASPRTALRHLVALALARHESDMGKAFWRGYDNTAAVVAHLEWLESWGYELAEIENAFIGRMREQEAAEAARNAEREAAAAAAAAADAAGEPDEAPASEPLPEIVICTCLPVDETGEVPDHDIEQCSPSCAACSLDDLDVDVADDVDENDEG